VPVGAFDVAVLTSHVVDLHRLVTLSDGGVVRAWTEVTGVRDGVVDFTHHYHFDDGEELLSSASLRFRTEAELRTSLTRSGFIVDRVHGGWHGEPVGHGDGEFVVLARVGTLAPVF
jgi:hypothetical protein